MKAWKKRDDDLWLATQRAINEDSGTWTEPMGGADADGNPLTVSFGRGTKDGHTMLGDGDRSESNFRMHDNHDHYGSGNGLRDNGTNRGQYSGPGA